MCKLNLVAIFEAAHRNRVGRAIWRDLFGPSWGEADIETLGERGMRDIGVIRTRYGVDTEEVIAPVPGERSPDRSQSLH